MADQQNFKILPPVPATDRDTIRYGGLWRFSVIVTSLVAIVPLVIMTVINYLHDQEAYRIESRLAVNRILSTTKRSLAIALEERRNALSLVIAENPFEKLASEAGLSQTLQNLQDAFGGFVDLGLIDSDGNQSHYTGPYDLKGKNYLGQDWFHEVVLRGKFVSDVFMGYRNFPHLVIALKGERGNGGFYIIRATIDMALIVSRIDDVELDHHTDAFLVNPQGVLQTRSALYGKVLTRPDMDLPPRSRLSEVVQQFRRNGSWVTLGYAYIENTPFILVVESRAPQALRAWVDQRSQMLWFLGASIAAILAVVLIGSNRMVNRLREADARRAKALHDLEYSNKLATIGRMAASVAHEINNPLAIINENAGLVKDMATFAENFPYKEKILGLVESIQKSVDRCSNVTHRLLGFAKRMDIQKEPIALDSLLREVVAFQRTETIHRGIQIDYHFPEVCPPIESDRGKLQQVFLNVLSNALAAIADGGKIDISIAQVDNNHVAAVVADNGVGISDQDLEHIFEPFFSTKGEYGTGLGLSITRDLIAKLGGRIDVQSELGRGTRFIVTLPIKS